MLDDETGSFEVPPAEPEPGPASYVRVTPRYFGLSPRWLVAGLAAVCLGAALVLLVTGTLAVGLLLLVAALLLAALFAEQARRTRASRFDRIAAAAVDNSRALAGFAGASMRAWTSAGRRVASLRLEATRLTRGRAQLVYALGAAAYAGSDAEVGRLRKELYELDERIAACARAAHALVEGARKQTSQERLAVGATEVRPRG
jgi:hypothetical protein